MTINVGIYEALVESGEEDVVVTRHGKPVAHIVTPQPHPQTPQEMLDDDARKEQRWLRWQAGRHAMREAFGDGVSSSGEEVLSWIKSSREDLA
jgi:antitoxin (DNA-binding transcriptional repressor) of toxin-antitoxin stability system